MSKKIKTVKPRSPEWETATQEQKDYYYRHNYISRPEVIEERTQVPKDNWLLKVVRNFTSGDESAEEAVARVKAKIEERNEQLSAARRKVAKNRKKV